LSAGLRAAIKAAALLSLPISYEAEAASTPAELVLPLAGHWEGALGYRDYQTDKLFELPVKTVIENVPDGATQVRTSVYDEGARQKPVWIISLVQWGNDGSVTTASLRAGREPETFTERADMASYLGPEQWTIVYRRTGLDDDKPAEIRVTDTRSGDELLSIKEVRPTGGANLPWRFRNQTRLKRLR